MYVYDAGRSLDISHEATDLSRQAILMLGKDINLGTVFQSADWIAATDPALLFGLRNDFVVKALLVTLILIGLTILIARPFSKLQALRICLALSVACLAVGMIGTYLSHIQARSVVMYSTTHIPPLILREGATVIVVPSILGGFGFVATALIALATQIGRSVRPSLTDGTVEGSR